MSSEFAEGSVLPPAGEPPEHTTGKPVRLPKDDAVLSTGSAGVKDADSAYAASGSTHSSSLSLRNPRHASTRDMVRTYILTGSDDSQYARSFRAVSERRKRRASK
ncbi:hypothetical protein [Streptomyces sp. NPDC004270]